MFTHRSVLRPILLSLALLLPLIGARCSVKPTPRPESLLPTSATALRSPRLVLLVVIDQARGDLFTRFGSLLTGGLARIAGEGVLFTQSHHDHARTQTAPGHATLATGLHPSHHGVIANSWFDRTTQARVYCVEDPVHERSPARLQGSTIGDWLKESYPQARVYSAAGKDRSAILMGGHQADGAYWFDPSTGVFKSSSYYPQGAPPWLSAFNDRRVSDTHFGQPWEPLPVNSDLSTLGIRNVDEGPYSTRFPRALGGGRAVPDSSFYNAIYGSPFLDSAVGLLAREIVIQEDLGNHDQPDLLALGFSALDIVGHTYGPDSPEYLDTILRLDRELGELLDFLDQRIGPDQLMVALSSDHGVLPLPESPAPEGERGRHFTTEDVTCLQQAGRRLADHLGPGDWLLADGYLNRETISALGLESPAVERAMAEILESCSVVEKVWTRSERTPGDRLSHPLTTLVIHSDYPERSPDLFLQLKPGVLGWIGGGTSHGSPYPYDTHVPMVLMVPGGTSGREHRPVRTVDLAPTLAAMMGLPVPEGLDGRDLSLWLLASRGKSTD